MVEAPNTTTIGTARSTHSPRLVYVIDDDIDVRKSLNFLLASSSITAWPFSAAADFIDQLTGLAPAPILLDVRMPGIDGLEMLAILKARAVSWPVVVMTAHGDIPIAVRAMKLGAIDFLEKPFEHDLLDQVVATAFGLLDRDEHLLRARDDARKVIGQLSQREGEVLTILTEGVQNKAAAYRLGLSTRTVEMYRANAFAKLKVRSIAEFITLLAAAQLAPEPK
jgi:two-component system response regulator FixJ